MFYGSYIGFGGGTPSVGGYQVTNSCRFNDDDSAYTYRTPAGAGNTKTWTVSFWWKIGKITTGSVKDTLFSARSANPYFRLETNDSTVGALWFAQYNGSAFDFQLKTTAIFRDPHAWYHIVIAVDTTQSTDSDRIKMYANGSLLALSTASYPSLNTDTYWNTTYEQRIGFDFGTRYMDGYLSEWVNIDGSALAPTSFAETDDNGVWRPLDISKQGLTFGDNGFYLDFSDSSHLGKDVSSTPSAATISNTANTISDSNLSTYTHSSIALGAAVSGRKIVVATTGYGVSDASVSSMTIGGVSATFVNSQDNDTDDDFYSEIWQATVPSGTTGDIVVALSVSCSSNAIGVYRVIGAGEIFNIAGDGTGDPLSAVLEIPAGGVSIGIAQENVAAANPQSWSWSGLTEDYDDNSGEHLYSGASLASSSYASTTVTADYSSSTSRPQMTLASFSPTGLNSFVSSGLASTDQMVDTPTNNYCTFSILNPLTTSSADGALDWVSSTDGANSHGTVFFDATDAVGFYWEYTPVNAPSKTASSWMIGIMDIDGVADGIKNDATYAGSYQIRCGDGGIQGGGGSVIANGTWDSGGNGGVSLADTVQVVVKAGKMYFGVNNVWYDSSDDSFANAGEAFTGITGFYTPTAMFGGTTSATHRLNCGNNGSYVRTKPTGLKDISTSNLTAPAIKDPGVHAHIELVDHGGTSTAFTLPWDADVYDTYFIIKNIDNSEAFYHVDTVRGLSAIIKSGEASPAAESTDSNVISVSGTTITLGSTLLTDLYHVECHKAGLVAGRETGDGAGNLSRTLSFNADSGFAIAAFTGEAGSGDTLDIGLSKPTERMWIKDRAGADAPLVYIKGGGATKAHDPDTTSALSTSTTYWNDTAPTTGIITLGSSNQTNGANTMVCWAWHSSDVYKIGTYEGNGSTDGPVIYLDDAPLQVEVKRHDGTGSMNFQDAKRDPVNPRTLNLAYDTPAADLSDYHRDFLANGFKPRSSSDYINASGSNYTYFAIIEHNFGGDGATPATAR